jgi:7-cyano-7-deazaguanine reductase
MSTTRSKKSQPYPHLTLLGNSVASFPDSPRSARLETFPNPKPNRDYWIKIDCPDFTSLCPVTGQPDFAAITIEYIPHEVCVETKSLKFYLSSYRNLPSFNEQVINRITDDLIAACKPRRMKVEGKFVPRGGLALSVTVEHPNRSGSARSKAGGQIHANL